MIYLLIHIDDIYVTRCSDKKKERSLCDSIFKNITCFVLGNNEPQQPMYSILLLFFSFFSLSLSLSNQLHVKNKRCPPTFKGRIRYNLSSNLFNSLKLIHSNSQNQFNKRVQSTNHDQNQSTLNITPFSPRDIASLLNPIKYI